MCWLRRDPEHRIDKKAVTYWRITGAMSSVFYWIVPVAYWFISDRWSLPGWILVPLALLALLGSILKVVIEPAIRWNTWRYDISSQEIDLLSGVFIRRRTVIPMVRVQHVDTRQGPLLRSFGLSSVTIATAAGVHEIPALADDVAGMLRDEISRLARVVEEDDV